MSEFTKEVAEKERKKYQVTLVLENEEEGKDPVELKYTFYQPKPIQFNRYVKELSKDTLRAARNITLSNVAQEDKERLERDVERYPGLLLTISSKFMGMLGMTDNISFRGI